MRSIQTEILGRKQLNRTGIFDIVTVVFLIHTRGDKRNKYMLLAGWEVCIVKNCDRGLENAAIGLRPRAAFSSPRFHTI